MNLSKQVGWHSRTIGYPSSEEVKRSTRYQRLEWNRFLPSPINSEQETILKEILRRGWN